MLSITFLGAAGTVTGSKFLIRYGDSHLLVDCGLFQGLEEADRLNRQALPLDPSRLSAVVLTHAHTDHAGGVPALVRQGFEGTVFCTEPTRDLCRLLWLDSARLQEQRASQEYPPMFDEEDALDCLELMETLNYYQRFSVMAGVEATFFDAGHILGSSWVELVFQPLPDWGRSRPVVVVFSGDVGHGQTPMLAPPDRPERADFLILESTYGDRLHSGASAQDQLSQAVQEVISEGSTLVIPAFAIQRCQDLAYLFEDMLLQKQIEPIPVFLDSPMACRAIDVYHEYSDYLSHQAGETLQARGRLLRYPHLQPCLKGYQSRAILQTPPPRVVISASGMAEGGRVLHHLRHHLPEPRDHVLMAGFQCPGTRGRQLLDGAAAVEIDGLQVPVRARISSLDGLSGHADWRQIDDWLKDLKQPPEHTMLVHGDTPALEAQKHRLQQRGWRVVAPEGGQQVILCEP